MIWGGMTLRGIPVSPALQETGANPAATSSHSERGGRELQRAGHVMLRGPRNALGDKERHHAKYLFDPKALADRSEAHALYPRDHNMNRRG